MAHPHTFPTLYNELKTLDLKSFKEYLKPNQLSTGTNRWTRNGEETASIGFSIRMGETKGYLELDYNYKKEPIKYRVPIVSKPSNLGKGLIWYFVCPHTGKHCKKLYLVGGYFLHREAFKGCMYESQTRSKNGRQIAEMAKAIFGNDDSIYKRYFKKYYKGKPTKRYLKYLEFQEKEGRLLKKAQAMF